MSLLSSGRRFSSSNISKLIDYIDIHGCPRMTGTPEDGQTNQNILSPSAAVLQRKRMQSTQQRKTSAPPCPTHFVKRWSQTNASLIPSSLSKDNLNIFGGQFTSPPENHKGTRHCLFILHKTGSRLLTNRWPKTITNTERNVVSYQFCLLRLSNIHWSVNVNGAASFG